MTFFECYADESLLKFLGFKKRDLSGGHSNGRSRVCGKLAKSRDSLGLVDEDPGAAQDAYLKSLLSTPPRYIDEYLILCVDERSNNKLLILRPDLENLIVRISRENLLDLEHETYGLSNSAAKLHDILMLGKNTNKRDKFVKAISDMANHVALAKLKELIKP